MKNPFVFLINLLEAFEKLESERFDDCPILSIPLGFLLIIGVGFIGLAGGWVIVTLIDLTHGAPIYIALGVAIALLYKKGVFGWVRDAFKKAWRDT